MKTKHILAVSGLVMALGMAQSASATVLFAFDPTGGGSTANQYSLMDQLPGNAIGIGATTAVSNGVGSTFTLGYQANLNTIGGGGSGTFLNGTGGNYFTFTSQFQEAVTQINGNTVQFGFAPGGTNNLTMWATNAPGVDLTGAGFGTGTAILTAHVDTVVTSNYTATGGGAGTPLDNNLGNNWVGTDTVTGGGTTDIRFIVDTVNAGYFPNLQALNFLTLSFFNTSQVTPYNQVDPSQSFNWLAGGAHASNVGPINGLTGSGPDFLFQADGNQSFDRVAVPEPASMLLLGLGFAALGLTRRRVKA